jgi:hypothetical protein
LGSTYNVVILRLVRGTHELRGSVLRAAAPRLVTDAP